MSESGLIPDDRQTRLASWLAEKRPDLASMYRTARDLLATAAKPGDERTRVSHICHSMREMMNRLPGALGIAGTGGGGPTHHEYLKSLHALRTSSSKRMRIISPKALKDDATICFGSWYGSPSVINERIAGGNEIASGINAVNKVVGNKTFDGILVDEM